MKLYIRMDSMRYVGKHEVLGECMNEWMNPLPLEKGVN